MMELTGYIIKIMKNRKPKVKEYKDERGENRLQVVAQNGNIINASSEGYKNKTDMREAAITSAIAILEKYKPSALSNEDIIKEAEKHHQDINNWNVKDKP
jgi:uncharacterized protein YegP (UPF0339 family)